MTKNTQVGAALLAIALTASACGGASELESEQAALLEDLEAQVDELTAEAEATEQAEPATTTTVVPKTTTAEPATTTTVEEDVVEESTTTVAANETAEAEDGPLVVESSEVLNSSMDLDQAMALVISIEGPTADLSSELQRVYFDFPVLSALPDTEIIGAKFTFLTDFRGDWKNDTEVLLSTTEAPENVVLTYQTELAALFPEDSVRTSTQQSDGAVLHVASVGGTTILAREVDGVTLVEIDANQLDTSDGQMDAVSGITPLAFGSKQGVLTSVSLDHRLRNPTATIIVTEPVDETEFAANEADVAAELGWTLVKPDDNANGYSVDGASVDPTVRIDGRTDVDGNPVARVQTQFFFG